MLGHRGLRDAELALDDLAEPARRLLAIREQLENPSADGITEDIERVHPLIFASRLILVKMQVKDQAVGGAVDARTISRVGSGNDSPGASESSTAISTRCMVRAPSAAKS